MCSDFPELGEELVIDHFAEEGHARRAAGAAFEADDAFHRGHMVETPAAEIIFEIDELFGPQNQRLADLEMQYFKRQIEVKLSQPKSTWTQAEKKLLPVLVNKLEKRKQPI